MKLNINQWSEDDRPREKLLKQGPSHLSTAELLAILIQSGSPEETAVELMRRVLDDCHNDLNVLAQKEARELQQYNGIGPAKSVVIMAALELGKRRKEQAFNDRQQIHSSADIYQLFHPILCDAPTEEFWVLLLNQATKVIDKVRISQGGINQTVADIRLILREAILRQATQIAVVHNHPSGNRRPSQEDKQLTQNIMQGAKSLNIRLIDHVIVTENGYFSFNDEGLL